MMLEKQRAQGHGARRLGANDCHSVPAVAAMLLVVGNIARRRASSEVFAATFYFFTVPFSIKSFLNSV